MADGVGQSVPSVDRADLFAADPYFVGHARPFREDVRRDSDVERLCSFEDEHCYAVVSNGIHGRESSAHRATPGNGSAQP
ncbi:hypothetical protein GCM10009591_26790 [Brachybacterium tyrofermentans]